MKKLLSFLGLAILCLFQTANLQAQTNDIFNQFPWLTNLVTPSNCTNEKVEVYEGFIYNYILVTDANGIEKMYNTDGQFYCQNAPNYDCITAYRLSGPATSWSCEQAVNCDDTDLIRRLQNAGTNCYSITQISKIEYEGNNYYLPNAGTTLGDLLRNGPSPCGVLETFPSLYDCEGRRVCDFGLAVTTPCPITRVAGTTVWTNEEASCSVEDPFSVDIIQRSINEDRFIRQGDEICKYVKEIIQFNYEGFTFFRVNEAQYAPSNCQSAVASRFYSCTGDFVGGLGNAPNCQNAIVCENLDLNSSFGEVIWTFEENQSNCDTQDPLSLPALQTAINTPPRINANGSICWYIKHIVEFQFEGKTFYRVVEDANPSQQCSVEWGTLFYTCEGEPIGGTGIYPECDDAAVCIYDIPTLNAAASSSGTIIWDSGIGNNEQDKIFEDFPWLLELINPNNCSSEKIEIYGGNAQHPYNYLLVTDANGSATFYNTNGQVYCMQTPTNICIDAYVAAYGLSSVPFRTWTCASTNCICPQVVIPVCGVDGNTYTNSCEAACAGVAIAFESPCNIDPSDQCFITITNNECRNIGVYDENDNLLTTIAPGPIPIFPRPVPTWEDTRPLVAGMTRTYIFKDGNLVLGRQIASCENTQIAVVSDQFSGCTDAVGFTQLTNVGCRVLQAFDTRGNLVQSAAPGEQLSLSNLVNIYILMADMDTVGIGTGFGQGTFDTKGCTDNDSCFITITNNECRTIGVYEGDNLLTTMRNAPFPNEPLSRRPPTWTDLRPLSPNTTRTYIFKENNLILGRQIVSCSNKNIPVINNQSNGCTDALGSTSFSNSGCRTIQVFNTSGTVIRTAAPGGNLGLTAGVDIYILMANRDTLAVSTAFGGRAIDSGGCTENNNYDCNLAGLLDFVDCAPDLKEVAVYRYQGSNYVVYFPRENTTPASELYAERCDSFGRFCEGAACNSLVREGVLLEVIYSTEGCPDNNENNNSNEEVFEEYSWLINLVNPSNCTTEKIAVYQTGIYKYLLITEANGTTKLYNEEGQFYCQNSSNYDCVAAYDLGAPIDSWTCGGGTTPPTITTCDLLSRITLNPDLCVQCYKDIAVYEYLNKAYLVYTAQNNSCVDARVRVVDCETGAGYCLAGGSGGYLGCTDFLANAKHVETILEADCPEEEGCSANIGTLFFRTCGNGQLFYLIETDDGRLLDYYLDASISYTPVDGQRVYFEYQNANFSTPCSIAERAVNISCIEVADDNPQPDNQCGNYSGVIVSESCDDGTNYFFIDADYGRKLDIYLAAGINYEFRHGQRVNFNFEPAAFSSPCSQAFRAVIITCIENETTSDGNGNADGLFNTYAWLRDYVNPNTCNGERISVYPSGVYQYVFIEFPSGGRLYFQDGTFYCQDSPGYDCRSAYNLTTPTDSWTCGNFQESTIEERSKQGFEQLALNSFPNPTTGQLTIQVLPNLEQEQQLRVIDLFGRVLVQEVIEPAGSQVNVDLSDYQNGVYYLELRVKGQRVIKKVIKQDLD